MTPDHAFDKEVRALGFELRRARKHRVYWHPEGGILVVSASVGGGRGYANALARAKRLANGGQHRCPD